MKDTPGHFAQSYIPISSIENIFKVLCIAALLFAGCLIPVSICLAQGENWKEISVMPTPRYLSTTCVVDGKIYVMGGKNVFNGFTVKYRTVTVFDPLTATWDTLASMSYKRVGLTCCALNGKIYTFGGYDPEIDSIISLVEVYDIENNLWETVDSIPTPRWFAGSCVLDGKIYVIGGMEQNSSKNGIKTVERYDPVTGIWDTCQDMSAGRGCLSVEVLDGKIYAIGGTTRNTGMRLVEEYDPGEDKWEVKTGISAGRFWHCSTILNGRIYAMGGSLESSGPAQSSVEVYDPFTDSWSSAGDNDDLPGIRCGLTAETINNRIYVFGGTEKAPNYKAVPEVIDYNLPMIKVKSPPILDPGDSLLMKVQKHGTVYVVPVGTPAIPDSLEKYKVASWMPFMNPGFKIPLSGIPIGSYIVCGVGSDESVDRVSSLFRLVDDVPEFLVQVRDEETQEMIMGSSVILNGKLFTQSEATGADLTGWAYDTCTLKITGSGYYDCDTTVEVTSDLELTIYLESLFPQPVLTVTNDPVIDATKPLKMMMDQSGTIYLVPSGTPVV